jgi:Zn-dependent protease
MSDIITIIFQLVIFLFSVVIHEVSHGYAAYALGDPTAKYSGRLTLNPLKHLDPFGSVIFPFLIYIASGGTAIFGWAKPVPYNPYNLRWPKWGPAAVGAAGPLSNITIALIFGLALRWMYTGIATPFLAMLALIVYINVLIAVFNLIPIPPLDGSKVLFAILPAGTEQFQAQFERYGFLVLIAFLLIGFQIITPLVSLIFHLITGFSFGI